MIINGIEFPNKIIKSIENKSLVVFVGAGVSMGAPTCLPSFDKLAEDIACGTTYVKKNNMPFVRLQGAWLEQVGFCAGDKIVAHIEEGRIVLVKDDK